jgi:hypothetical protein
VQQHHDLADARHDRVLVPAAALFPIRHCRLLRPPASRSADP